MAFSDSPHQEMEEQREPCSQCIDYCHRNHKLAGIRKRRFCFFKVLIGKFEEQLRIPPAFLKHLEHEQSDKLVLEGPSGKLWHMTLERTTNSMILQNGWEKFVKDHSLELGDFLVFRYNGDLNFTVQIFDKTACEREDLFGIEYGEEPIFHEENEAYKELNKKSVQDFLVPNSKSCMVKSQRKNVCSTKKKRVIVTGNSSGKPISSFPRKGKGVRSPSDYPCGYFVSSRRPVTDEERARAYEAASSFKSSKPFFTVVLKKSHVYVGFYLHIPNKFARNYPPRESKSITISDPSGRIWPVQIHCNDSEHLAFSGGWRILSLTNNLEEGDACVFELLDECNFLVHIFRVVKITQPLVFLRGTITHLRREDHMGIFYDGNATKQSNCKVQLQNSQEEEEEQNSFPLPIS